MNEFFVGVQGDDVVFLKPIPQQITREQAVRLAAWLQILADPTNRLFPKFREQILLEQ